MSLFALVLIKDPKGKFEPQGLLSTNLSATPVLNPPVVSVAMAGRGYFPWKYAPTWVLKQGRQWSPLAIRRTTPALLALFSIVVTLAHQWQSYHPFVLPKASWYQKSLPTFADALALVRQQLWQMRTFQMSTSEPDTVKVPRDLFNAWFDLLCYAA